MPPLPDQIQQRPGHPPPCAATVVYVPPATEDLNDVRLRQTRTLAPKAFVCSKSRVEGRREPRSCGRTRIDVARCVDAPEVCIGIFQPVDKTGGNYRAEDADLSMSENRKVGRCPCASRLLADLSLTSVLWGRTVSADPPLVKTPQNPGKRGNLCGNYSSLRWRRVWP